MNKIVVTRRIPEEALGLLKKNGEVFVWDRDEEPIPHEVLLAEVKEAAGLFTNVGDRIDKELIDHAPKLKVISTMAVGYDNINVMEAASRGISVGHTPGVLTETTADLTFAILMAAARRVVEGSIYVRQGQWKSWGPMLLTGQDVYGATIGIIGMGRIGEGVALNAAYCSLEELLKKSDFVVLLAPGSADTRHMIGKAEFELMKRNAVFVNASRGTNVDETALYTALENGDIWAAGLDVFEEEPVSMENPLLSLPNVTVLPHIGSATIATRTKMAVMAAQNLIAGLAGEELPFQVKLNKQ
jgi:glyoxylate reductase